MILPGGRDCRIKWRTLNMGAFRDKEIGEFTYGIASGPLALRNDDDAGVIIA